MKVEYIGLLGGFFTTFCLVPQVWKIIKTNHTKSFSLVYAIMVNIGIVLWLIYGVAKNDIALILTNVFSLIFTTVIFSYKMKNIIFNKENI
jgi:MtN3 and saliva related transmembrane protein